MLRKKKVEEQSYAKRAARYGLTASRIFLQDLVDFISYIMTPSTSHRYMGWSEYKDIKEKQARREKLEYLYYLQRRKLIITKKIGEKLMVRLTAKGWQQALRDRIKCTRALCANGICMVVWDVPESERYVRDTLRKILRECRFNMIQKSVWSTNKDVVNELCALLQGAKLDRWVRIIIGNELNQSALRRAVTRFAVRRELKK